MSGIRFIATLIAASLVLAACGGGSEDNTAAANNTGGSSTGGGSTGGGSTGGGSTGGGSGGGSTTLGSADLSWNPPTAYTDGSQLPINDIDHYNVYSAQSQSGLVGSTPTTVPNNVTVFRVDQLASGTWYFVITAVDINGVESVPSNMASKTI